MTERAVKHYKSAYAGAREKKLVTEIVTKDSETGRFLRRMEEKRLLRPCFETIDMRGKVPGECKRYVLNDRVFFLDDISYGIYQKGIAENNGVFTIGTYEAIVNGKHTYRAMREAEERERQARQRLEEARSQGSLGPSATGETKGRQDAVTEAPRRYNPGTIPFGYFLRRCEERLQYVTPVELTIDGQAYQAATRDLSISGLQIAYKGALEVMEGARVLVSFTELQAHYPQTPLDGVAYELVGQGRKENQTLLRLRLVEAERPRGFTDFAIELIERYRRKYKLDVEDRFCSTASWLYERIYSESMVQIPLFVREEGEGLRIDAVAATDGNRPLINFFHTSVSSYDFSPLCLPHRLQHLAGGGEMLLALYRCKQDGVWRICSAADFELAPEAFDSFVRHALSHRESCVLRVAPCALPFREANMKKFELMSQRLAEKSAEEAERLRARLQGIAFAATAAEVTAQVAETLGGATREEGMIWPHWVGGQHYLAVGGAGETVPDELLAPELIRFGYVERRREERYLAETAVEVLTGGKRVKGRTRDISTHGLAVLCDEALDLEVGSEIEVALVSLQKKRPSLNLMAVPYRVMKIEHGSVTALMLERLRNSDGRRIDEFFVELINKNRNKLAVDLGDTLGATLSRAYESLIARNLTSIPFFIAREERGKGRLQRVAVPEEPVDFSEFFRAPSGSYDFSWLTDPRLVDVLYRRIGDMARQAEEEKIRPEPLELEAYLYWGKDPDSGIDVLYAGTEHGFNSAEEKVAFVQRALAAPRHRFVKLMATYTLELNRLELDNTIELLRTESRPRATQLQDEVSAIIGYGELIDITAQVAARFQG